MSNPVKGLWRLAYGANISGEDRASFKLWAPKAARIEVQLTPGPQRASGNGYKPKRHPLIKDEFGVFRGDISGVFPGDRYVYVLDGGSERPDPVSRHLPEGVFGPTEIVDPSEFLWTDSDWKGIPLNEYVIYEIHTGTFTPEGTFHSAIEKIPHIKSLGVTCVQIMPVFQFSGGRGWGYDGVNFYAVQNSYGGPNGLKEFVNACHKEGLAVCLDVVYNHFGPEGSFIQDFGPYYTPTYSTPWGKAINYDSNRSDFVREFVVQNALYWVNEYHADALRLDATEWLFDLGPLHILQEIRNAVKDQAGSLGREIVIIAESDQNNPALIRPPEIYGQGYDAQYSDDFHHSVHAYLTGERQGYYEDFTRLSDIAKSVKDTFVYEGRYSRFREKRHGAPARTAPGEHFVINLQNHDQVGNRPFGDRLNTLISFEAYKAASVLLLSAPNTPFLFMGQEYGENNPFQYFVDFKDAALVEAVRKGRRKLFGNLPADSVPDPQAEETFQRSKLNWGLIKEARHQGIFQLYQDLIALRRSILSLKEGISKEAAKVTYEEAEGSLAIEYPQSFKRSLGVLLSFSAEKSFLPLPFQNRIFREILNTENERYGGPLKNEKRVYQEGIDRGAPCGIIGEILPSD